ncbi:fumarylacetoacetate hydrolase family protein [Haliea sp. E1-2-M8]|uniref:fumarylacetoacetate hydrolase family protein n=1 Tax=Haliea sp. E1-2-M8 TaxID=3064706 RepID=UPI00271754A9|nr:fumarylacetoacetate hydrolase family protein [Haliea sp. E1-2-M8]MDO8861041.1 fumarylacetoacetate hydrolase family protein [Haliea sp. E1-2-M8]
MRTIHCQGRAIAPSKVVCIGRNYVAHIEELGSEVPEDMVVFLKPNSALGDTLYAAHGEPLHYEGEIAFLVEGGQLAAVGFGLDLTKRSLQSRLKEKGLPWERAKAFDGAALFSEFLPLTLPVEQLSMELRVDGETRQQGGVPLMLYPPQSILDNLAGFMTLEDGDILMTGTPAGVGEILGGQHFQGRVLGNGSALVEVSWTAR